MRQQEKYSASNPANFEELWSFNATRIQLISLIIILSLILGSLFALFFIKGPFSSYFSKNDVSIERKQLEDQHKEILQLKKKIDQQENYTETIRKIILGEPIDDTLKDQLPDVTSFAKTELDSEPTENEKVLADKVKDDLRTTVKKKGDSKIQYFVPPVRGVISQKFDLINHPAVDIVTPKDRSVMACLSGTVIFTGYTQNDGFVIIIDHANGFLSVYKHNKILLKKSGSKVQMNDPIAIVGNTGENSTGPHLHFELWYNQSVVDPTDYMDFKSN